MVQHGGKRNKKVVGLLVLAMVMSLVLVLPVSAGGSADDHIRGVVPARNQAAKFASAGGNLSYHRGPVMHTNSVYAIYWIPAGYSVSSNYQSLINGFFQNVAADNGKTSNVYYSDTQYYDNATGNILYSSTFAGGVVDTNPFPANGCSDSYTSVCLSDAQLQAELQKVMAANGLTGGSTKEYFIFTPKNVGSCAGSSCAFSQFCAYHSWIGSGSTATMYANQPYAAFVTAACDSSQHPNGDDADATINVVSHEHNETITDPQGSAWYDRRGYENGDKCAWNFGTALGSTSTGSYNQVIGTGKYYLQQEWSNFSSKCVLTGQ
ncbi:MAG TPA: hypothetical protein VFK30_12400 [Anaerolineae bacterium]|nr:hypothetical protein [Anaerolineae bacterium]